VIRYDLACERGHAFDGWFRDSATYDRQAARKSIACPQCGSTAVEKQIMAPNVAARSSHREEAPQKMLAAPKDPKTAALLETVRQLRQHVAEHADYVGKRFPEEARRIHYREVEPRGIYGEASIEEAASLIEEGIEVHPLPKLPEEAN
jgi:hypothetical protein